VVSLLIVLPPSLDSNAGSAALIVLLILVGCGVFVLLRLRRNARLQQRGHIGLTSAEDGIGHELDRFIVRDGREDGDEDEETYSDATYRQSTSNLSNGGAVSRRHESAQRDLGSEEIFDVGNESDEEESRPRQA
jgi:hypothetical protein